MLWPHFDDGICVVFFFSTLAYSLPSFHAINAYIPSMSFLLAVAYFLLAWENICCPFLFRARLFISFLACYYYLPCHSNAKINASVTWYCILPSFLPSFFSREQYMLSFSSQRRLQPRVAPLGQLHTVFAVVVMSSILDYYLSCRYHCIAAEHISTRIICSLYCAMICIKFSYNSSSDLLLMSK